MDPRKTDYEDENWITIRLIRRFCPSELFLPGELSISQGNHFKSVKATITAPQSGVLNPMEHHLKLF
jgi:hypothetical protein